MNSNWTYSPETPNLGQIRRFLEPCDLEFWRMTLKNIRAPLLSIIKLYASFHHHIWIQTGVTVRKRLTGVMTSVTLTFDLWPWSFAWTSLLSMVITSGNFMMIRWQEHSEKGVTDRQTDRRTDWTIHRAAWSQLKIFGHATEAQLPRGTQLTIIARTTRMPTFWSYPPIPPNRLMITHTIESYWIPSQKKTKSKLQI